MTLRTTSIDRLLKDLYQDPGKPLKQWVVDSRREAAWESETCPRVEVPMHIDNCGSECRNVGSTQWKHLDHDSCYVCGDLHEATATRHDIVEWIALRAARPPITADHEALSDEVQEDLRLREFPVLAMLANTSAPKRYEP